MNNIKDRSNLEQKAAINIELKEQSNELQQQMIGLSELIKKTRVTNIIPWRRHSESNVQYDWLN